MKLGQSPIQVPGVPLALASAALFGAAAPLSKMLLASIGPQMLAGLLYLGAGLGWRSCTPRVRHSGFRPLRPLSGGMICPGSSSLFSLAASLVPCCSCLASAVLRPPQRLCSSILKALQRWGLRGWPFAKTSIDACCWAPWPLSSAQ